MSDGTRWIERAAARGAWDLLLLPDEPPQIRVGCSLEDLAPEPLTAREVRAAFDTLRDGAGCIVPAPGGGSRWIMDRGSALKIRVSAVASRPSLAIRLHPSSPRSAEQLGLPAGLTAAATGTPGLVLMAGPPGSGRSTTLAAALSAWARSRGGRLLLVGAPCDGTVRAEGALVTAACLGSPAAGGPRATGFATVEQALAAAAAADVDAVAVPALPTRGALDVALELASSGVSVFALATGRSAPDALRRLASLGPASERKGLRRRLALALAVVTAQQLVPRRDARERVAVFDLLRPSPEARWLIAEGAWGVLQSHIEGGGDGDLESLDRALAALVLDGVVEARQAAERAGDRDAFVRRAGVAQALDAGVP